MTNRTKDINTTSASAAKSPPSAAAAANRRPEMACRVQCKSVRPRFLKSVAKLKSSCLGFQSPRKQITKLFSSFFSPSFLCNSLAQLGNKHSSCTTCNIQQCQSNHYPLYVCRTIGENSTSRLVSFKVEKGTKGKEFNGFLPDSSSRLNNSRGD